mmetsp:Transcript_12332/g.44969  ORF Transcript_12332/g.44969 Transcript_12332/m.44969 type:complete len:279 (-) Transcript_12332:93-929(-)
MRRSSSVYCSLFPSMRSSRCMMLSSFIALLTALSRCFIHNSRSSSSSHTVLFLSDSSSMLHECSSASSSSSFASAVPCPPLVMPRRLLLSAHCQRRSNSWMRCVRSRSRRKRAIFSSRDCATLPSPRGTVGSSASCSSLDLVRMLQLEGRSCVDWARGHLSPSLSINARNCACKLLAVPTMLSRERLSFTCKRSHSCAKRNGTSRNFKSAVLTSSASSLLENSPRLCTPLAQRRRVRQASSMRTWPRSSPGRGGSSSIASCCCLPNRNSDAKLSTPSS